MHSIASTMGRRHGVVVFNAVARLARHFVRTVFVTGNIFKKRRARFGGFNRTGPRGFRCPAPATTLRLSSKSRLPAPVHETRRGWKSHKDVRCGQLLGNFCGRRCAHVCVTSGVFDCVKTTNDDNSCGELQGCRNKLVTDRHESVSATVGC